MNENSLAKKKFSKTQKRLDRLAWFLDSVIPLPGGFKLGLDGLVGLIPVAGDAITAVLSTYIVGVGVRSGASKPVIFKMLSNIVMDAVLGTLPFIGDLFDIAHRANHKNVQLIQGYLEKPEETKRASRLWVAGIVISLLGMLALIFWLVLAFWKWVFSLF